MPTKGERLRGDGELEGAAGSPGTQGGLERLDRRQGPSPGASRGHAACDFPPVKTMGEPLAPRTGREYICVVLTIQFVVIRFSSG